MTTTIQQSKQGDDAGASQHHSHRQDIINSVLDGLKATDEKGQPKHYVISHSYTEHEEIVSEELSSVDEVVNEFISILNSFNQTDDDECLTIEGYWEDTDVFDSLYIHEFK